MKRLQREQEEKESLPFRPQLVTLSSNKRMWETISVPDSSRKNTIQHSPRASKERFESLYKDSERRKKAVAKQKHLKDLEIEKMHKKTNQILKLSKIFKSGESKAERSR